MPKTRRLLREDITYSDAKEREVNILQQLDYYDQQNEFFSHLNGQHSWMRAVVAHHLGLRSSSMCQVAQVENWLHGSFNVCIPVTVRDWTRKQQPSERVLLRFPLPYRVGEAFRPGNSDEKIRCEAGTYAWLQQNCPDVPIPQLYGFAISTGETFTQVERLHPLYRVFHHIRCQILQLFGRATPSPYIRHQPSRQILDKNVAGTGYLLIEYIEESQGTMLSSTWPSMHHDDKLRANLFRDLSRILLSITRIPLPRIGSFVIDNDGFLRLINRPLSVELPELENDKIPTGISRHDTYSTVDSYIVDLLAVHDSRLRNQPNAVNNLQDCASQLAALATMRTISPVFFDRKLRRGPFVLTLTDLHPSNIFVDDDWHITCLVDLEWACSRPIEMIEPPYWLTNRGVDQIVPEEYDIPRAQLMDTLIFEENQRSGFPVPAIPRLSDVMKRNWEKGTFWYTLALSSPTGLFTIFYEHIQSRFAKDSAEFTEVMPFYWDMDIGKFVVGKLSDKEKYDIQLQEAFENSSLT